MMYQRYFQAFNEKIKVNNFNNNIALRKKRDLILDKISKYLNDNNLGDFTFFDQGSYSMNTGIKPIDEDYNIDVGICFDILIDEYKNPVEVKRWIYDALQEYDEIKQVEINRSNVSIMYKKGEEKFYVNLAVYASNKEKDKMYIAKGKSYSCKENRIWQAADPEGLKEKVNNAFCDEEDKEQFRRIVRYLKSWRKFKFIEQEASYPTGMAVTVLALQYFSPVKYYGLENYEYDDLTALRRFVDKVLSKFETIYGDEEEIERLTCRLPVKPENNVFDKMSDFMMYDFKQELKNLSEILGKVQQEQNGCKGYKFLQETFGQEFPIPHKFLIGGLRRKTVEM